MPKALKGWTLRVVLMGMYTSRTVRRASRLTLSCGAALTATPFSNIHEARWSPVASLLSASTRQILGRHSTPPRVGRLIATGLTYALSSVSYRAQLLAIWKTPHRLMVSAC